MSSQGRLGFAALFLLLAIARFPNILAQESITVCPVNVQEFILRNDELLPPGNIQATSEDSNNNPATGFTDTTSAPWCTAEEEGTSENYVELTFTEQVVAEFLESTGLLNSWVSNFSIQYSQSESGEDFMTYGVLENPQSFIIEDILTSPGYFSLERPIVARRLRLLINSGMVDPFGRLCWEVEIFGCPYSKARQMVYPPPEGTVSTHVPATTAASPQSLPPNTPVNCPQTSAGAISRSERQQEILIVVLPAALATVVIVLVIAIVSILVCVCITRRSTKEKPSVDQSANNPAFLYDSPRPVAYDVPRASIRSRGGSFASSNDTLHTAISNEVKNPIYVTKQGNNIPVAPHPFASLSNQVESSATNDYEMITDNVASLDNRFYEMQRSNSQQSGTTRPELPAARTNSVDQRTSSYYAMIPGSSVPATDSTCTAVESSQTVIQTDAVREDSANVPSSGKAHGYAKVHKPSPSNGQARTTGPDVVPTIAEVNQTTL